MSAVTLGCPCNDDEAVSSRHSDFVTGRRNCGKKWCPEFCGVRLRFVRSDGANHPLAGFQRSFRSRVVEPAG